MLLPEFKSGIQFFVFNACEWGLFSVILINYKMINVKESAGLFFFEKMALFLAQQFCFVVFNEKH